LLQLPQRPAPDPQVELLASERPRGIFSRQLILGDNLDTERIDAGYEAGVLTLRIPVAERAKPRKITIRTDEAAGSRVLDHAPWPDRENVGQTAEEREPAHA